MHSNSSTSRQSTETPPPRVSTTTSEEIQHPRPRARARAAPGGGSARLQHTHRQNSSVSTAARQTLKTREWRSPNSATTANTRSSTGRQADTSVQKYPGSHPLLFLRLRRPLLPSPRPKKPFLRRTEKGQEPQQRPNSGSNGTFFDANPL
ncbi:unnamed protein product [Ectocarpus sp. 8 AP-2014]